MSIENAFTIFRSKWRLRQCWGIKLYIQKYKPQAISMSQVGARNFQNMVILNFIQFLEDDND